MSRVVRSKKSPKVKCPICLEILFNQEIGIPDCCQHVFCFTCLANWSKVRKEIFIGVCWKFDLFSKET
jgi:hypothetical protein